MSDRSTLRLVVLQVLVLSLLLTLLGPALVPAGHRRRRRTRRAPRPTATQAVVTPAVRGLILDDQGRPLAQNRESIVVTVNRTSWPARSDRARACSSGWPRCSGRRTGACTSARGAAGRTPTRSRPSCWNGSPLPADPGGRGRLDRGGAVRSSSEREDFPGVTAELETVREYPEPLAPTPRTSSATSARRPRRRSTATPRTPTRRSRPPTWSARPASRQYDDDLRGQARRQDARRRPAGNVTGTSPTTPPTAGDYLVTNIDAQVQAVAEQQLARRHQAGPRRPATSTSRTRLQGRLGRGRRHGRQDRQVIAMASYPTYDPNIWVGGISTKDYKAITSKKNDYPTCRVPSRAFRPRVDVQGRLVAGGAQGPATPCTAPTPARRASRSADTIKNNYESEAFGRHQPAAGHRGLLRHGLLQVAYDDWLQRGRASRGPRPPGPVHRDGQGVRPRREDRARPARRGPRPDLRPRRASTTTGRPSASDACKGAQTRPRARDDSSWAIDEENCSPRATSTAPVTRPTSPSARATRRSPRCRWRGSTPRSPTAARCGSRTIGKAHHQPRRHRSSSTIKPARPARCRSLQGDPALPAERPRAA